MVFGKKTEHPGNRVEGLAQADPQRGGFGNRALNQLSAGLFEGRDARGQGTPRSLKATRLHEPGRRVRAFGLDPRPTVELPLQPLGADRPVGQTMWGQHRESQAAMRAQVTENTLPRRTFRISVARVASMAVHRPRTTAGTHRTKSAELIFAQLNRGASPQSSRDIKPL